VSIDDTQAAEIKSRLDDLDDAVRGITVMLSVFVLQLGGAAGDALVALGIAEARRNLADPKAWESTR
jgi:hypothetical protein